MASAGQSLADGLGARGTRMRNAGHFVTVYERGRCFRCRCTGGGCGGDNLREAQSGDVQSGGGGVKSERSVTDLAAYKASKAAAPQTAFSRCLDALVFAAGGAKTDERYWAEVALMNAYAALAEEHLVALRKHVELMQKYVALHDAHAELLTAHGWSVRRVKADASLHAKGLPLRALEDAPASPSRSKTSGAPTGSGSARWRGKCCGKSEGFRCRGRGWRRRRRSRSDGHMLHLRALVAFRCAHWLGVRRDRRLRAPVRKAPRSESSASARRFATRITTATSRRRPALASRRQPTSRASPRSGRRRASGACFTWRRGRRDRLRPSARALRRGGDGAPRGAAARGDAGWGIPVTIHNPSTCEACLAGFRHVGDERPAALAYIRVSSRAQGFATQRTAIERWATARGDVISHWRSEKKSAKTMDRPELAQLLADAKAGKLRGHRLTLPPGPPHPLRHPRHPERAQGAPRCRDRGGERDRRVQSPGSPRRRDHLRHGVGGENGTAVDEGTRVGGARPDRSRRRHVGAAGAHRRQDAKARTRYDNVRKNAASRGDGAPDPAEHASGRASSGRKRIARGRRRRACAAGGRRAWAGGGWMMYFPPASRNGLDGFRPPDSSKDSGVSGACLACVLLGQGGGAASA